MKKKLEKIVFFGNGPVAAKTLEFLLQYFEIEFVVQKPPKDKSESARAINKLADRYMLDISTIASASDSQQITDIIKSAPIESKVGVIVDFGLIIPKEVIDSFELGIVNSHFSLLPEWRGADPISFAILSGQKQTGVSLMLINERLDEGPLLSQAVYDIPNDATTPSLTDDLIELSNQALKEIIPLYIEGKIDPAPQEEVTLAEIKIPSYSRKLTKNDGKIDWNKSADEIEREVRAYAQWPKSYAKLGQIEVVLTKSQVIDRKLGIGELLIENKQIIVGCYEKSLKILELKPAGKQLMSAESFIAGYSTRLV